MDDEDDMPLIPLRSRHQDRVPITGVHKGHTTYITLLTPAQLAEREAKIQWMIARAAKGLPLTPRRRR